MALCVLCRLEAEYDPNYDIHNPLWKESCKTCGTFIWAKDLEDTIYNLPEEKRNMISGFIREQTIRGNTYKISTKESIEFILDSAPKHPLEKLDRLLLNINESTKELGDLVEIRSDNYAMGYVSDSIHLKQQISYLFDLGLIDEGASSSDRVTQNIFITVKGMERARLLLQESNVKSNRVFVAMSFSDDLTLCWENGLKKGIENAGYQAIRVDKEPNNDKIDDLIIVEINRCKFLVADLTKQRQGVYYEAGYAQGKDLPVIWTCKDSDAENIHFDTRQYNQIRWSDEEELAENLKLRILSTIGPGDNYSE